MTIIIALGLDDERVEFKKPQSEVEKNKTKKKTLPCWLQPSAILVLLLMTCLTFPHHHHQLAIKCTDISAREGGHPPILFFLHLYSSNFPLYWNSLLIHCQMTINKLFSFRLCVIVVAHHLYYGREKKNWRLLYYFCVCVCVNILI